MTVRTIAIIKAQIIAEKNTQTALAGLTSPSQTAIWNLLIYIQAVAINLFEQVMSLFQSDIEVLIASAVAGSDAWIQKKMLEFQYSATNPQIIKLNNYAPYYDPIDTTLQIISRCSVKTGANKTVTVKLATGEPPAALSAPQLTSAQGYLSNTGSSSSNGKGIGFAGVQYNAISLSPDLLLIYATCYYDGQYASVISANVIAAINNYLANIDFDGEFRIQTMIDYIQAVPGVIDFKIQNLALRAATVPLGSGFYLISNYTLSVPSYPLVAGYVIGETTATYQIGDNINFVAQN